MSVTDTPDEVLADTQNVLNERKGAVSWRTLGAELDVPHGILHAIGTGAFEHVSWETVRKVRVRLGIGDPGEIVSTFPCPDCGAVHTGRCHGREVKVVPVGKPRARRRYFRPCLPVELRGAYEQWRSEQ